jgi:hypothetical protein
MEIQEENATSPLVSPSPVAPSLPQYSIPLDHPSLTYQGRWTIPPRQGSQEETAQSNLLPISRVVQWASGSVSFAFTGTSLRIKLGEQTKRVDLDNGGTRTILWSLDGIPGEALDVAAGELVTVYEGPAKEEPCVAKITLVDWASVLHLSEILVGSVRHYYSFVQGVSHG